MSTMFVILAVAGWIWTAVFFSWLLWRVLRDKHRKRRGGFEVVSKHDKLL